MEECLSYFRDALHRPEQVPVWDEWWAAHESLVRASFAPLDYMRLKVRRLIAAHDLLIKFGALNDLPKPIRLDLAFLEAVRGVRWFERCGHECRVAVPFEIVRVADWDVAQATCANGCWENVQLEAQNALTVFLNNNYRARYQQWNDIVVAAKSACLSSLTDVVWQPFCERNRLAETVVQSVQWDILGAIMEREYDDCPGRPTFALHLFNLYRAGHFPCGWRGEWPAGQLLVL